MASRSPRRSFAPSFVVTLAATAVLPACTGQTYGPNPPQPQSTVAPSIDPQTPSGTPTAQLPTPPTGPILNPPAPVATATATPASSPREWTILKFGNDCEARTDFDCAPGDKCNPPPPKKIACPANLDVSKPVKISQIGNTKECMVVRTLAPCPPPKHCNPPPPQRLPCPE